MSEEAGNAHEGPEEPKECSESQNPRRDGQNASRNSAVLIRNTLKDSHQGLCSNILKLARETKSTCVERPRKASSSWPGSTGMLSQMKSNKGGRVPESECPTCRCWLRCWRGVGCLICDDGEVANVMTNGVAIVVVAASVVPGPWPPLPGRGPLL